MAVLAAALTFAYIGRFWLGLFSGARRAKAHAVPALLTVPIAGLAALAIVGGIVVEPFAELAGDAASVTHGATVDVDPAYHLDARAENVMAVAAWVLGALILMAGVVRDRAVRVVSRWGEVAGPRRVYGLTLRGLNVLSDRIHDAEVRDLRTSLAAVMVPGGLFAAFGLLATPMEGAFTGGSLAGPDLPIMALLALAGVAAVRLTRERGRLAGVLTLSVVGFALAGVYAIVGAPDVALVAVLVETILTLVFVGVFARLPKARTPAPTVRTRRRRRRNAAAGVVAGATAFVTVWATLSRPAAVESDAVEHIRRAPEAHGGDVVTVILADFRGFDTMVEITVLAAAIVGVASLLRHGRQW
jgi:multicomponent Na+:H+ antiporter subunit A